MKIQILTLFPEMFAPIQESIIGRAKQKGLIEIEIYNIRDYSLDKHKKCDDAPFGGGAGMVMTPQPISSAIESIDTNNEAYKIYLSPKGRTFTQAVAKEFTAKSKLLIICGHYEGIDQRIIDLYVDEEISIGDYVLTGGELPAMVITDAVSRLVSGVITKESLAEESFENGLLEYPQYTRPQEFKGLKVPQELLNGNHKEIELWRKEASKQLTKKRRPDIYKGE